jgi:septal ring factor EnvC (AmiA/AmiB activator)
MRRARGELPVPGLRPFNVMKPKIILPILVVVAVGLLVAVIVSRKTISVQREAIAYHSNEWQKASIKVDDLTAVNHTLEGDLDKRKTEFLSLTNAYAEVITALAKTEADLKQTEDSLKLTKEEVAARDAKIAALETQNKELDTKSAELSTAITNLTTQIEATQQRLATAEGDKALLQKELSRLMAEKAQLERQLNDLQFLKKQVAQLKAELSISKRLDWIRKGLFTPGEQKGATLLMQGNAPKPAPTGQYDLNVEIHSDGSVKVIPPLTNAPAAK